MNLKPLRTAGIVSFIMGIVFTLTGAVVWGVVTSQLAAENITVPKDAMFMQGAKVQDPLSAFAQADIINKHALAGAEGKTYAQLGAEATAARNAGDTARADELTKMRTTAMNASFLRSSLFTSVLAYGVCLFAIGVGVTLIVFGWAFTRVGAQAATVRAS
ncbi:MAG: aromatic ring-opening dioxygenase LigA [Actinomycetes bacterium]